MLPPPLPPMIAITLDDANLSDYTISYQLAAARSIPVTSYIVTDWIGQSGKLTWDQIHTMRSSNFGIECHTKNHVDLRTLTEAELRANITAVNTAFISAGLPPPEHHAYPYGENSVDIQAIIADYRYSARTFGNTGDPIYDYEQDINWFNLRTEDIRQTTSFETVKGWIDAAIAQDRALILTVHEIVEAPASTYYDCLLDLYEDVLDYVAAKRDAGLIDPVTIDGLYRAMQGIRTRPATGSMTLHGETTGATYNSTVDYVGFVWGTTRHNNPEGTAPDASGYDQYWISPVGDYAESKFAHTPELLAGTTFYYRAAAKIDGVWTYGEELTFAVAAPSSLPNLYPAQVGSPWTTLAASYTTGGATMTVVDATKLPDAPNIVCLAGAVAGEFRYTGKVGNTLLGVIKLPGTPNATWLAGTYAFRGIAAYDINSLQQSAVSVQAQIDNLSASTQAQIDNLSASTSPIIGIEWDTMSSSPTLTRIDALGHEIEAVDTAFFDRHLVFGGRWRCVRDRATGQITFGSNARGDGLILDGSAGDVLVREPAFWVKYEYDDDTGLARWWVSARPAPGFRLHPYFYMRGGGVRAPYMFSGAYEAYGFVYGGQFRLGSASGKQPVTGGVGYPDLPNNGRLTIDDAELYASRISPGNAGITSFWGYCADQLLMYIEYGTFDIQTALGEGIVSLPYGEGFAGKLTGADNIDSRLAENGTGTGDGVDGKTPVCWRGIENPYGNVQKFIIGCNFKAGGIFRTIKRDGSGTLAGIMADGSYEEGSGVPQVNGFVSGLLEDELGGMAFMPSAVGGSSSTYLCDYWYGPPGDNRILLAGGYWNYGRSAGPGFRIASNAVSYSNRGDGARVEFRPSQGV